MKQLTKQLHTELKSVIENARLFCASTKSENESIRDWAREENIVLTRGQVSLAKEQVTEIFNGGDAVNHFYFG